LRYSATHKTEHNKIHRLDALDAYNQKLVKKIAVRGITVKGLAGPMPTSIWSHRSLGEASRRWLGWSSRSAGQRHQARAAQCWGATTTCTTCPAAWNSTGLRGLGHHARIEHAELHQRRRTARRGGGGDVNEAALRRIQIREAIKAHFEKEQALFDQGIKVLSLFFIDEVAKYRQLRRQRRAGR
jgi:type III restriction enzyme